jgi:P27 family predicted phage terminase small subunit
VNPPSHLSKHSRALWRTITTNFTLEATETELLRLGLEALDRCEQARVLLAEDGIVTRGRYGQPVAHPALAVERDSRLAAARLFKQLALPEALSESISPLALKPRRQAR